MNSGGVLTVVIADKSTIVRNGLSAVVKRMPSRMVRPVRFSSARFRRRVSSSVSATALSTFAVSTPFSSSSIAANSSAHSPSRRIRSRSHSSCRNDSTYS